MRYAWLAVVLVAGCGPKLGAAQLRGTVWNEICPGSNPEISWIRLRPDGGFDFSYPKPDDWRRGDDETWSVDGKTLTVSWNNGFAVSQYNLAKAQGDRIPGSTTKSCGNAISLVRAR